MACNHGMAAIQGKFKYIAEMRKALEVLEDKGGCVTWKFCSYCGDLKGYGEIENGENDED